MYRPFKEFINAQFSDWASAGAPGYKTVKSLARGGGVTSRRRLPSGTSFFLIVQHVSDRDLVSVTGGWAKRAWFADWDAAEMGYWRLDDDARARFVQTLRNEPAALPVEFEEGTFAAMHLEPDPVMHELEVGDGGVPYELIAQRLRDDPGTRPKVEMFLGERITGSLVEGGVQSLHAQNAVISRLLSWECWFDHVLVRPPEAAELESLCMPASEALQRQATLLVSVMTAMTCR